MKSKRKGGRGEGGDQGEGATHLRSNLLHGKRWHLSHNRHLLHHRLRRIVEVTESVQLHKQRLEQCARLRLSIGVPLLNDVGRCARFEVLFFIQLSQPLVQTPTPIVTISHLPSIQTFHTVSHLNSSSRHSKPPAQMLHLHRVDEQGGRPVH